MTVLQPLRQAQPNSVLSPQSRLRQQLPALPGSWDRQQRGPAAGANSPSFVNSNGKPAVQHLVNRKMTGPAQAAPRGKEAVQQAPAAERESRAAWTQEGRGTCYTSALPARLRRVIYRRGICTSGPAQPQQPVLGQGDAASCRGLHTAAAYAIPGQAGEMRTGGLRTTGHKRACADMATTHVRLCRRRPYNKNYWRQLPQGACRAGVGCASVHASVRVEGWGCGGSRRAGGVRHGARCKVGRGQPARVRVRGFERTSGAIAPHRVLERPTPGCSGSSGGVCVWGGGRQPRPGSPPGRSGGQRHAGEIDTRRGQTYAGGRHTQGADIRRGGLDTREEGGNLRGARQCAVHWIIVASRPPSPPPPQRCTHCSGTQAGSPSPTTRP